ncbi:MAG: cytochrome [Conexibacter sp.]|nr:cytochrome [Conexibacter sp.]
MPGAAQAWEWTRNPLPFLERCRARYGDVFTLRMSHSGTWVVLSDPADVKRVFTAEPARMGASQANAVLGPLLGRRSVMLLDEPEHLARRRIILPPFHGQRMASYAGMTAAVAQREIERWPAGQPFELWPRMQSITLDVILNVVFGTDAEREPRLRRVRDALERLTSWLNDPRRLAVLAVLGPRWIERHRGFARTRDAVASAVLDEVRRRRAGDALDRHGDDMISLLLEGRYDDGAPLTDEDLADELITLLSDGPTSTSLAWAFERLLRHPEKLERLRDEVTGGGDGTYMEAVIRETLRLCPPVPVVVRRLLAPMELGGHRVPAGTTVAPCVSLLHRRADIYPDPDAFLPERFLEKPPGTYTWIPFGGGVRRCLAASFAVQEMQQVLATVLGEVDLRAVGAGSERVARSSIAFVPDRRALAVVG